MDVVPVIMTMWWPDDFSVSMALADDDLRAEEKIMNPEDKRC